MTTPAAPPCWDAFQDGAEAVGLNVRLVLPREVAERGFRASGPTSPGPIFRERDGADSSATTGPSVRSVRSGSPAALHPGYEWAVLLGSAGVSFWEKSRAWAARRPAPPAEPMDRFTEEVVEELLEHLRADDPTVLAAYPFRHRHQLVPFLGLLQGSRLLEIVPFGVPVHPTVGPWYAWRAAVLTRLPLPEATHPERNVCATCEAPCVAACPAGAVRKEGFQWEACADFRLREATCRATCLARRACPVGTAYRYGEEQMTYHYGASLRMIEAMKNGEA